MSSVEEADHPLELLRMVVKRELAHHLESLPNSKELIIDQSLFRPMDMFTSTPGLHKRGVKKFHKFHCTEESYAWDDSITVRVFFVRPTAVNTRYVCQQIAKHPGKQHAIIWANRAIEHCLLEIERNGLYGMVKTFDLNMSFLPIETDLFTLNLGESTHIDLYSVANGFVALQSLYGTIPTVYGIGKEAKKMWTLAQLLCEDNEPRARPDQPISHLFIFDRTIDPVSVLLTGGTYEALLHDTFGIESGKINKMTKMMDEQKNPIFCRSDNPAADGVVKLSNDDDMFASIRNKYISAVLPFLSSKIKETMASTDSASGTVKQILNFVEGGLREYIASRNMLAMHLSACEHIIQKYALEDCKARFSLEHDLFRGHADIAECMRFVEERMVREENSWSVISMMCLTSLALSGIPDNYYRTFVRRFVKTYGYQFVSVFYNLRGWGLLYSQSQARKHDKIRKSSETFERMAKRLHSISGDEEIDLRTPTKMSYVFGGRFAPVLCQLVEETMTKGWNTAEYKKMFGDDVFVEENSYTPANSRPDNRMKRAIMVFFLGGVTYAEVAALRLLAVQKNFQIIIATTHVIDKEEYLMTRGESPSALY